MTSDVPYGILFKQIHDYLEKQINNSVRKYDLTMAQMAALLILSEDASGKKTLKELERNLHVAQSTAAGIINRLEQKGFVEAHGQPDDKRIKTVAITNSGVECCKEAGSDLDLIEQEMLSLLDDS